MSYDTTLALAFFLVRTLTGLLFFAQAYDKIFKLGLTKVADVFDEQCRPQFISSSLFRGLIAASAYVEFLAGILLLAGLFKGFALFALSFNMLFVAVAFSLIQPLWDMRHFYPRLIFLVALLIMPPEWDRFSLDHILF